MLGWQKTINQIQRLENLWYMKLRGGLPIMATQKPILGSILGNKRKKKAIRKSVKSQKCTCSAEKDRYNAALKLAIKKDNKNAAQIYSFKKEDEDYHNLVIKEPFTKEPNVTIENNLPSHITHMPKIPNNITLSFPDLYISTKSRNLSTFEPAVIINSTKNRDSLKKLVVDSPSSFRQLFLSRKSAKVDLLDNNLLIQMMEKIESLTKFSKEQSEYIKQLEDKIDNLIKTDRNAKCNLAPLGAPIMASQVTAFVNSNLASDTMALFSPSGPTFPKPTGSLLLSINFSKCTCTIIHNALSDLQNHLQTLLSECHNTKDVKVKEMNQNTKNN